MSLLVDGYGQGTGGSAYSAIPTNALYNLASGTRQLSQMRPGGSLGFTRNPGAHYGVAPTSKFHNFTRGNQTNADTAWKIYKAMAGGGGAGMGGGGAGMGGISGMLGSWLGNTPAGGTGAASGGPYGGEPGHTPVGVGGAAPGGQPDWAGAISRLARGMYTGGAPPPQQAEAAGVARPGQPAPLAPGSPFPPPEPVQLGGQARPATPAGLGTAPPTSGVRPLPAWRPPMQGFPRLY